MDASRNQIILALHFSALDTGAVVQCWSPCSPLQDGHGHSGTVSHTPSAWRTEAEERWWYRSAGDDGARAAPQTHRRAALAESCCRLTATHHTCSARCVVLSADRLFSRNNDARLSEGTILMLRARIKRCKGASRNKPLFEAWAVWF